MLISSFFFRSCGTVSTTATLNFFNQPADTTATGSNPRTGRASWSRPNRVNALQTGEPCCPRLSHGTNPRIGEALPELVAHLGSFWLPSCLGCSWCCSPALLGVCSVSLSTRWSVGCSVLCRWCAGGLCCGCLVVAGFSFFSTKFRAAEALNFLMLGRFCVGSRGSKEETRAPTQELLFLSGTAGAIETFSCVKIRALV